MELLRSNVKPGEKATGECGVDYREINCERRGEERRGEKGSNMPNGNGT